MYSEKRNVLQLVALLKAHGVTHIVLCPGSRNAPLIHSFATDKAFTCYRIVDERSAGFFALGVIQAVHQPVAVCCTSGTAALNLGPAVAEAYYQQLPLLVITADRPAAWIGQMDGQTIPQTNMFREITRYSVNLPQMQTEEEEWYGNRLINEAILGLDNPVKGPAHINIPLSEPLFGFHTPALPPVRVIRQSAQRYLIDSEDRYDERFAGYSKRMIIVGQLPPDNGLAGLLDALREKWGVVVLAEQVSNIPAADTGTFDVALYSASEKEKEELTPEVVVTLGGHIVSKRLKQFIRSADIREHWHISPSGEVTDTFQRVTDIIRSDPETFLKYLAERSPVSETKDFQERWRKACAAVAEPDVAFSDLYAIGACLRKLPENASLQLANSNSVRLAQLFAVPPSAQVFSNRGTNGIEGSLSTAVGYAAASGRLTFLVIGDLSFFYDLNGLWNPYKNRNLRILLNNNGGGEIFHILPGLNKSEVLNEYISATHATEAKAWAEQQGYRYLSARNAEELHRHLPAFTEASGKEPVLLEVFTSMEKNAEQIRAYYHQQKKNKYNHDNKRMDPH
ncbi:2-succinyl-5-enolpyruvyl-6-hydroxy-3-cyclohexene-1-carboxylic-acid synthase [Limibacterium fermenti]|uniref:2-succinyl-5-enolpyruvyl-6-hydroxy-3- cyclohexene-1-carboxylic-acid synthase n=1 Tax=Limibacterium fermenti TaxID=3229863 RepID=UPI003A752031